MAFLFLYFLIVSFSTVLISNSFLFCYDFLSVWHLSYCFELSPKFFMVWQLWLMRMLACTGGPFVIVMEIAVLLCPCPRPISTAVLDMWIHSSLLTFEVKELKHLHHRKSFSPVVHFAIYMLLSLTWTWWSLSVSFETLLLLQLKYSRLIVIIGGGNLLSVLNFCAMLPGKDTWSPPCWFLLHVSNLLLISYLQHGNNAPGLHTITIFVPHIWTS